jgi:pilus assembly protein CpaF
VGLIIQQSRLSDGSRKVTHITEVVGTQGDVISLQDIFVFERDGLRHDGKVIGRFRATGVRPKCSERLAAAGVKLSPALFQHLEHVV